MEGGKRTVYWGKEYTICKCARNYIVYSYAFLILKQKPRISNPEKLETDLDCLLSIKDTESL